MKRTIAIVSFASILFSPVIYIYVPSSLNVGPVTDKAAQLADYSMLDCVSERYDVEPSSVIVRNAFHLNGHLWGGTDVKAELFSVDGGRIVGQCSVYFTPFPEVPSFVPCYHLGTDIAIYRIGTSRGVLAQVAAHAQSSGIIGEVDTNGIVGSKQIVMQHRVRGGEPQIVYVEGDTDPVATRKRDLQSFLSVNRGKFLVLTLALER